MFLDVVTTNRAKNLYEREGYEVKSTITLCGCMECLLGEKVMLYDFLLTVKAAPHECVIRTGQH